MRFTLPSWLTWLRRFWSREPDSGPWKYTCSFESSVTDSAGWYTITSLGIGWTQPSPRVIRIGVDELTDPGVCFVALRDKTRINSANLPVRGMSTLMARMGGNITADTDGHYRATNQTQYPEEAGRIFLAPFAEYRAPELYYMTFFHERTHAEHDINSGLYSKSRVTRANEEVIAIVGSYLLSKRFGVLTEEVRREVAALLFAWHPSCTRYDELVAEAQRRVAGILASIGLDETPVS